MAEDWSERRDELKPGMVFKSYNGILDDGNEVLLRLDGPVPGDASKWYVEEFLLGSWIRRTEVIESCDLIEKVDDPAPPPPEDWYERRHELRSGMVFKDYQGDLVQLDRTVPGDGTKWYVGVFSNGSWSWMDDTIEPGDLVEQVDDPAPPQTFSPL